MSNLAKYPHITPATYHFSIKKFKKILLLLLSFFFKKKIGVWPGRGGLPVALGPGIGSSDGRLAFVICPNNETVDLVCSGGSE
jgi:hypothetical protein